jgi:hypothetical protein
MGEYMYCPSGGADAGLPEVLTPQFLYKREKQIAFASTDYQALAERPPGINADCSIVTVASTGDRLGSITHEAAPRVQAAAPAAVDVAHHTLPIPAGYQIRLYQALAPTLAVRGTFFGSHISLWHEDWAQLDAAYYDAPGEGGVYRYIYLIITLIIPLSIRILGNIGSFVHNQLYVTLHVPPADVTLNVSY